MRPLLLLPILGCDLGKSDLPTEPPAVTPFAVCAWPETGWDTESWTQQASVRGLVQSVGSGVPEGDCLLDGDALGGGEAAASEATWITVLDAETGLTWTLAVVLAGFELPFAVGDEASFAWDYTPPEFGSESGSLTLSDFEGALVVWVDERDLIEDVVPPSGLHLAAGDAIAEDHDDCGAWSWRDLEVTTSAASGTVPYGDSALIDGYTVHDGGLTVTDDSSGGCLDWWMDHTAIAAERE